MRRFMFCLTAMVTAVTLAGANTASAATVWDFHGTMKGSWMASQSSADSGLKYRFNAQGDTSGGLMKLTGTSGSLGFVRQAYCEAVTLVTNRNGSSMKIRIRSKVQYDGGFSCKSYTFYYRMLSGNGAFADKTVNGTGRLSMTGSDHGTFSITFY